MTSSTGLAVTVADAPTTRNTLTSRAVRGAAWTLPASVASRAVGLVGTLVLARYLAPGEYGEVSAAAILMLTASSITTFGIGIYLVANPDTSRAETFHATCWFLATGGVAIAVPLVWQQPLAGWFGARQLGVFLPLLALSAALERLVFVPERLLVRTLRFDWLALARALGELTFTTVSVTLAAAGVGAMAIAWGNLARSVVRLIAIVPKVDRRDWLEPHRLKVATIRKIAAYGASVSATSIATFGMRRWDNLLVSRYFGAATMGMYNYAYNLADTPAVAIGEQITDVIGASFPHAVPERRAAALIESCTMISMIMFPLAFGLAAVGPTLVQAFFDERWRHVGVMLVFLSVLSAPRPLANVFQAYFWASGRQNTVLWLEWVSLAGMVGSIVTVGRFGILWTCAAVGGVFVLRTLLAMAVVRDVTMWALVKPLLGPLAASAAMAGVVAAIHPLLHERAPLIQLVTEISAGAVVYGAGSLVFARSQSRRFIELVRSALWSRS